MKNNSEELFWLLGEYFKLLGHTLEARGEYGTAQ